MSHHAQGGQTSPATLHMIRIVCLLANLSLVCSRALPVEAGPRATFTTGVHHLKYAQPSVVATGDHEMTLSNGDHWEHLNTGVEIMSEHAGLWRPKEHQHRIRKEDIDHVMGEGQVKFLFIGKGVTAGGVAKLMDDAQEEIKVLSGRGVQVYVGSTYDAKDRYNTILAAEAPGTVAGFFHTGC